MCGPRIQMMGAVPSALVLLHFVTFVREKSCGTRTLTRRPTLKRDRQFYATITALCAHVSSAKSSCNSPRVEREKNQWQCKNNKSNTLQPIPSHLSSCKQASSGNEVGVSFSVPMNVFHLLPNTRSTFLLKKSQKDFGETKFMKYVVAWVESPLRLRDSRIHTHCVDKKLVTCY